MRKEQMLEQVLGSFQDPAIRDRQYYPEFRRSWESLLCSALDSDERYFAVDAESVYTVKHSFAGIETEFHFDQLKIADWYQQESSRKKRVVFQPKKLRHNRSGLFFHEYCCVYDPNAAEPALTEAKRNIVAAAMPELPPKLHIVYGNKWVDGRFNAFLNTRLPVFVIETEYVPAFLATPFEVCLYLFLMDQCIIRSNYAKVKDEDLKQYLHIFKGSSMLKIKGLM